MSEQEHLRPKEQLDRAKSGVKQHADVLRRDLLAPKQQAAMAATREHLVAQSEQLRSLQQKEVKELKRANVAEKARQEQEKVRLLKEKREAAEKAMMQGETLKKNAEGHKKECVQALTVTKGHEAKAKGEETHAKAQLQAALSKERAETSNVASARAALSHAQTSLARAEANLSAAYGAYASAPEDQKAQYAAQIAHFSRYVEGGRRRVAQTQAALAAAQERLRSAVQQRKEKHLQFTHKQQIHKLRIADRKKAENTLKAAEIKFRQLEQAHTRLKAYFTQEQQRVQSQERVVQTVDAQLSEASTAVAAAQEMYQRSSMIASQAKQAQNIATVAVETTDARIAAREDAMLRHAHTLAFSTQAEKDLANVMRNADMTARTRVAGKLAQQQPGVSLATMEQHMDLQDLQNRSIILHDQRPGQRTPFLMGSDSQGQPLYGMIDTEVPMSADGKLPMRAVTLERSPDGTTRYVPRSDVPVTFLDPDRAEQTIYGSEEQRKKREILDQRLARYEIQLMGNGEFENHAGLLRDPLATPPQELEKVLQAFPEERLERISTSILMRSGLPKGEGYDAGDAGDARIMEKKQADLDTLIQEAQKGGLDPSFVQTILKGRSPEDFQQHMRTLLTRTAVLDRQMQQEKDPVKRLAYLEELSARKTEYAQGLRVLDEARSLIEGDVQINQRKSTFARFVSTTGGGDWKDLERSFADNQGTMNQANIFRGAFLAPLKVVMDLGDMGTKAVGDTRGLAADLALAKQAEQHFTTVINDPQSSAEQKFDARFALMKAEKNREQNMLVGLGKATADTLGLLAMPLGTISMPDSAREALWSEMKRSNVVAGGLDKVQKELDQKGILGATGDMLYRSVVNPLQVSSFFAGTALEIGTGAALAKGISSLKGLTGARLLQKAEKLALKADAVMEKFPDQAADLASAAAKTQTRGQLHLAEHAESLLSMQIRELDRLKHARDKGQEISPRGQELLLREQEIRQQLAHTQLQVNSLRERAQQTARDHGTRQGARMPTFNRALYGTQDALQTTLTSVGGGLSKVIQTAGTFGRQLQRETPTFGRLGQNLRGTLDQVFDVLPGHGMQRFRTNLHDLSAEDVRLLQGDIVTVRSLVAGLRQGAEVSLEKQDLQTILGVLDSIPDTQAGALAKDLTTVIKQGNPELISRSLARTDVLLSRYGEALDRFVLPDTVAREHLFQKAAQRLPTDVRDRLQSKVPLSLVDIDHMLADPKVRAVLHELALDKDVEALRDHMRTTDTRLLQSPSLRQYYLPRPILSPRDDARIRTMLTNLGYGRHRTPDVDPLSRELELEAFIRCMPGFEDVDARVLDLHDPTESIEMNAMGETFEGTYQQKYTALRDRYLNVEAREFDDLGLDIPIYQVRYLGTGPDRYPRDIMTLVDGSDPTPRIIRKGGDEFVLYRREGDKVAVYFADINNLGILNGFDAKATDRIMQHYMEGLSLLAKDTSLTGDTFASGINAMAKDAVLREVGESAHDTLLRKAQVRKLLQDVFDEGDLEDLPAPSPDDIRQARQWLDENKYVAASAHFDSVWDKIAVAMYARATNPATAQLYSRVNLGGMTLSRRFLDPSKTVGTGPQQHMEPHYLRTMVESVSHDIHEAKDLGLIFADTNHLPLRDVPQYDPDHLPPVHLQERRIHDLIQEQARLEAENHHSPDGIDLKKNTRLTQIKEELDKLAALDPISGVLNEHAYTQEIVLGGAERLFSPTSYGDATIIDATLDLFGTGPINNKMGYDVPDEILQRIGAQLQKDFPVNIPVQMYRKGGGEFHVVAAYGDASQLQEMHTTLMHTAAVLSQQNRSLLETMPDLLTKAANQSIARSYLKNWEGGNFQNLDHRAIRENMGQLGIGDIHTLREPAIPAPVTWPELLTLPEGSDARSAFLRRELASDLEILKGTGAVQTATRETVEILVQKRQMLESQLSEILEYTDVLRIYSDSPKVVDQILDHTKPIPRGKKSLDSIPDRLSVAKQSLESVLKKTKDRLKKTDIDGKILSEMESSLGQNPGLEVTEAYLTKANMLLADFDRRKALENVQEALPMTLATGQDALRRARARFGMVGKGSDRRHKQRDGDYRRSENRGFDHVVFLDVNQSALDHHKLETPDVCAVDLVLQERANIRARALEHDKERLMIVPHKDPDLDSSVSSALYLMIRNGEFEPGGSLAHVTEEELARLGRNVHAEDLAIYQDVDYSKPNLAYLFKKLKKFHTDVNDLGTYDSTYSLLHYILSEKINPFDLSERPDAFKKLGRLISPYAKHPKVPGDVMEFIPAKVIAEDFPKHRQAMESFFDGSKEFIQDTRIAMGVVDATGRGLQVYMPGRKSKHQPDNGELYAQGVEMIVKPKSLFLRPDAADHINSQESLSVRTLFEKVETQESTSRSLFVDSFRKEHPELYVPTITSQQEQAGVQTLREALEKTALRVPEDHQFSTIASLESWILRKGEVRSGYEGHSYEQGGNADPWNYLSAAQYLVPPKSGTILSSTTFVDIVTRHFDIQSPST